MTKSPRWFDDEEETLYHLPPSEQDPLNILQSTRTVLEQGEQVWINPDAIERLGDRWAQEDTGEGPLAPPPWDTTLHFHDESERSVNWLLLLDALNFCFWAEKGQERWNITYHGKTLNGYWAETAALKRAVEEGMPLWDANFLSTIDDETMAHIFRGAGTIPLFAERVAHAREVGRVLLTQYNGQFTNAITQAEYHAMKLVKLLERDFSSFRDISTYRQQPIPFLKRAQICVADLASAFQGQGWGAITNLEQLTIFADYKLPQVLRHYSILEYHPSLAQRIDNQELLSAGSEEEIEIRAATVWAGELLRQALQNRNRSATAADIDMRLWLIGQQSQDMRPYHRTRTIYY